MRKFSIMLIGLCLIVAPSMAQNITLTGKVTDAKDGFGLPGVSVTLKKGKTGVKTDLTGKFSIMVPEGKQTIVFSFTGYVPEEVLVTKTQTINIILTGDDKQLNDVVVVGYGTQKRTTSTASISKVSGDKVENKPFASVDQMLQGAAAGLQSSATTGQPGANQPVRVRGIGSFNYGAAEPLYIIDGVQINSGDLANGNGNGGGFNINSSTNVLATINSDDIESISILKDAAAISIYGSRGSNGVIIITTKSGKNGKGQFRFDVELGNNKVMAPPVAGRPIRATDWFMLLKEGMVNANFSAASIATTLHNYGDTSNLDTDWFSLITKTGTQQQYNISVSGGQDKIKYFLSGGYFKQEGTTIGTGLSRYTGNVKITYTPTANLSLTTKMTVGDVVQNSALASSGPSGGGGFYGNPTYVSLVLRPTQTPFNNDGTFNISTTNTGFPAHYNPLYVASHDKRWLKAFNGSANQSLEYKIVNGLKFTSNMGLQYSAYEEYLYNNPFHGDAAGSAGSGTSVYTRNFLYDWVSQFDYHLDIIKDKKFSVDVKVGHEAIKNSYFNQLGVVTGFPPNSDLYLSTNGATSTNGKASGSDYSFDGYFANSTFSFGDRYSLSGSFRRDASSRFGTNDPWGNFYSVGGAWNVSNEEFFKGITHVVSNLKLRASYGTSGNAEIGNYQWRPQFSYGYNYNGISGGTFSSIGNTALTWEQQKQFDIGVDVSLFKNRLNFVVDYYKKQTIGALLSQQISRTTGFSGFINNVGGLMNEGLELTINATPIEIKDFKWEINFNFTHNKNSVTDLPAGDQYNPQSGAYLLRTGHSMYEFYTRGWAGVDPADGAGMWYTDSTQKITTKTRTNAGLYLVGKSADPKYYGSLGNTFTYKNFSFTTDFYYNYGNYFQEAYTNYFLDGAYPVRGKYGVNLQRWQNPGDVTDIPKYVYGTAASTATGSDRTLYKGDYIRLRNVQLLYRLTNKNIMSKLGITALSFYGRGTNLFTKTYANNILSDPEQGILGINNQAVIPSKSYTVGINVTF